MRKLPIIVVLLALLTVLSCKPGDPYGFIDQPLQGQFEGASWTYVSGTADSTFPPGKIGIELYDIAPVGGDPWAFGAYSAAGDTVMFSVPTGTGLYRLSLMDQTVTLYESVSGMNYICIDGAVEIQTIDTTAHTLSGRINARSDGGTFVNGNFTATYR